MSNWDSVNEYRQIEEEYCRYCDEFHVEIHLCERRGRGYSFNQTKSLGKSSPSLFHELLMQMRGEFGEHIITVPKHMDYKEE